MPEGRSAECFVSLLEPLRGGLFRYAQRAAWEKGSAPDVVQEAVMKAWREFRRFEPGTDFKAWVYRIMVNTIFSFNSQYNRSRKVHQLQQQDAEETLQREAVWATILEDPERVMESLDDRVVQALDGLSPDERQCLLLRLLEGFTYREIAAMLSIPMGTVMSHVYRARLKLREELAGMALEEGIVREGRT